MPREATLSIRDQSVGQREQLWRRRTAASGQVNKRTYGHLELE